VDLLELQGPLVLLVPVELQELRVLQELLDLLVCLVLQGLLVLRVLQELLDLLVCLVLQELRVPQGLRVLRVPQGLQVLVGLPVINLPGKVLGVQQVLMDLTNAFNLMVMDMFLLLIII
jgi:hypothetical protein